MRKFKIKSNIYKYNYQWQDKDINSHNEKKMFKNVIVILVCEHVNVIFDRNSPT